jgi:tetratricopeptide (TPR) repeat protein
MSDPSGFWSRVRASRIGGVALIYLGGAWVVLQVIDVVAEPLEFPNWVAPVAIALLAIGLFVVLATAWVQHRPAATPRARRAEVPGAWELAIGDLARSVSRGRLPHPTWSRVIAGGVLVFTLLFAGAFLGRQLADEPRDAAAAAPDAAPAIVVLPMSTVGADTTWREAFVHLLSTSLDGAGGIHAIEPRTMFAAFERADGESGDLETSLAVARSLGARHAVLGSVVRNGDQLVVSCRVYDVESGASIAQARASGTEDEALTLVNGLSLEILRAVLPPGERGRPVDLRRVSTGSFDAFKAFLEGEALMREARFSDAMSAYERATTTDSTFALAWWRLGQARAWLLSSSGEEMGAPVERALALRASLPARQRLYVQALHAIRLNSTAMVDSLRDAVGRNPADAEAWYYLGETLFHLPHVGLWDPADADAAFLSAQRLDPGFAPYQLHRVHIAFQHLADSAAMVETTERYGRLAPTSATTASARLALDMTTLGDSASRLAAIDSVAELGLQRAGPTMYYLTHPRFWPVRERLLESLLDDPVMRGRMEIETQLQLGRDQNRGRIDGRLEYADRPDAPPIALCLVLVGAFTADAVTLPDEELDARLSREAVERLPQDPAAVWPAYSCAAHHAKVEGRTSDYRLLRAEVSDIHASLDTLQPQLAFFARAIDAYTEIRADWRLGDRERALERARALSDSVRASAQPLPDFINVDLGEYLIGTGRAREAIRYLLPTNTQPHSQYLLGKAYEDLGELEEARDAYTYFLQWWSDPSPPFQPLVDHARAALARIHEDLD